MRPTLILIFLFATIVAFSQSSTYKNNYGTNIVNGKTGDFNKSSFSWTITQNGNLYNIKTNALAVSFNVTYSHFDSANKLFMYNVVGSGSFDGANVKIVMTTSKLSDYANGIIKDVNLLAIVFTDNSGYIYKLNK
jgi:predicted transport protein